MRKLSDPLTALWFFKPAVQTIGEWAAERFGIRYVPLTTSRRRTVPRAAVELLAFSRRYTRA